MSDTVTFTIDGQEVQAVKGTLIIEAAKSIGIQIPHYCYHPGLPIVGSCRMCLVEIDKVPKMQPSCATPVSDGMVVRTRTPQTLQNRRSVLEFLLANHPLDCPVCDQAGECELQNFYMEHGLYDPRYDEDKTKRKKAFPLGPYILLDQERCILCTRCVRFTREITKTRELGVLKRGHRSNIDVMPGFELNNPYSGNVADVCPVGALTDRDFRFKCRVWFLGSAPSICPGCSRGCNIEIHFNERFNPRYHDQRVHRLKPRYNEAVNEHWICDAGRYSYHAIDAPQRLKRPMVKRNGEFLAVSWADAVREAASCLKAVLGEYGTSGVGILLSPQMSNEELFYAARLFKDLLRIEAVAGRAVSKAPVYSDDFLITADKNPNSKGVEIFFPNEIGCDALMKACSRGRIQFLYIFHQDLTQGYDAASVMSMLKKIDCVIFHGALDQPTAAMADIQLPAAMYAEKEGSFTNVQGRVQRFHPAVPPLGQSMPDLEILSLLASELGLDLHPTSAPQVFDEIGKKMAIFSEMTWQSLGTNGQLLNPESGK
jgi:NADH-quinone oxidoreductase subunit G